MGCKTDHGSKNGKKVAETLKKKAAAFLKVRK